MRILEHDTEKKVFIVAEAGVNHEGDFDVAKALVREARNAGADAVKFQTYLPHQYIAASESERFARVRRFALPLAVFKKLGEYAAKVGIVFFSTPLDPESVDALDEYVPIFKVSSGDMDFRPLVVRIAKKNKPMILSTGMASIEEIKRTVSWIEKETSKKFVKQNLAILHCIAAYPAPYQIVNLNCIQLLRKIFGLSTGYSDHTTGSEVPPIAVAAGARIIEKHFTLGRRGKVFRDHFISLEPDEFSSMVKRIRHVEMLLGSGSKQSAVEEKQNACNMKRGIAVKNEIKAGQYLKIEDFLFVRPQRDFKYSEVDKVRGRQARRDIKAGHLISKGDLQA